MGLSKKIFQILAFVFLSFPWMFFCRGEFPLLNTCPESVATSHVKAIHQHLKQIVKPHGQGGNFFSCAFSFSFPGDYKAPLVVYVRRKHVSLCGLGENINLIGSGEGEFVFRSNTESVNESNIQSTIVRLQEAFYDFSMGESVGTRLLATNFKTINLRAVQTSSRSNYGVYNTDSECHAIYALQRKRVINKVVKDLKAKMGADERIVAIVFHGCTTRDMCALCSTNMNMIQYLGNKGSEESFLGYLRSLLIEEGMATANCSVSTVISSLNEFPGRRYGGNNLWFPANMPHFEYGYVNQFRFEESPFAAYHIPYNMIWQPHDGNSAVWSILYRLWQKPYTRVGMENLRKSAAKKAKADGQTPAAREILRSGAPVQVDHLRYFSSVLMRPIVLFSKDEGENLFVQKITTQVLRARSIGSSEELQGAFDMIRRENAIALYADGEGPYYRPVVVPSR
jgi:hypothetical protein